MSDFQPQDRQMDHNLHAIGQQLSLPRVGDEQAAAWRNSGDAEHAFVRRTRPRNWFAMFGSAAAAAAVVLVFMLAPGSVHRVEAATIWRSLREAMHRGFRVEMQDVEAQKFTVSGHVDVLFPQPMKLIDLLDDASNQEPSELYAEVSVNAADDAEEVPGLRLRAAGAYAEGSKWLFARVEQFPDKLIEEQPFLNLVVPALRRGVLLDLEGLDLGDDNARTQSAPGLAVAAPASLDDDAGANDGFNLSIDGNVDHTVRQLLAGNLKREDFPEIVSKIESLAHDTHVEQAADGAWVLTAARFMMPDDDPEAAELMKNATLRVEYVEGEGIRLAELTHVGPADGLLRFSFIDTIDNSLLNRQRYVNDGVMVLDKKFFEMFEWLGKSQPGTND